MFQNDLSAFTSVPLDRCMKSFQHLVIDIFPIHWVQMRYLLLSCLISDQSKLSQSQSIGSPTSLTGDNDSPQLGLFSSKTFAIRLLVFLLAGLVHLGWTRPKLANVHYLLSLIISESHLSCFCIISCLNLIEVSSRRYKPSIFSPNHSNRLPRQIPHNSPRVYGRTLSF